MEIKFKGHDDLKSNGGNHREGNLIVSLIDKDSDQEITISTQVETDLGHDGAEKHALIQAAEYLEKAAKLVRLEHGNR